MWRIAIFSLCHDLFVFFLRMLLRRVKRETVSHERHRLALFDKVLPILREVERFPRENSVEVNQIGQAIQVALFRAP